jgi:hypothetical protein
MMEKTNGAWKITASSVHELKGSVTILAVL